MIYFRGAGGQVFAYETQEALEEFGSDDLLPMSSEEVDAHLNPPIVPLTREQVAEARRLAYADPLTGSDPLYIEYQRAIATDAPADEITTAKAAWLLRAEEIAARYPWPE